MTGFIEGGQRSQTLLFPDRLDDWIGKDDLVRAVDKLDLSGLGCNRSHGCQDGAGGFSSGHAAEALHLRAI